MYKVLKLFHFLGSPISWRSPHARWLSRVDPLVRHSLERAASLDVAPGRLGRREILVFFMFFGLEQAALKVESLDLS